MSFPNFLKRNKVTASNKTYNFHFPLVWASESILDVFDGVARN